VSFLKLNQGDFSDKLALLATQALIDEARITPKPGLVDENNSGAHRDMSIETFLISARALTPYFREIAEYTLNYTDIEGNLLDALRPIGIAAEDTMFSVTNGVNTHKGAIYSLGMTCVAAAWLISCGIDITAEELKETIMSLASGSSRRTKRSDAGIISKETNGDNIYRRYGISGILGEAAMGYPNVFEVALPVLQKHLAAGCTKNDSSVAALLHLISVLDDTNIISRCGIDILREVQLEVGAKISKLEHIDQLIEYARMLDEDFIARNISPGGCADLLAVTLFVDSLSSM